MSGNGEKPRRIDGRLAVFGGNNNSRRLQQVLILQSFHHLSDRAVDKLNLAQQFRRGGAGRVLVAAEDTVFNELLSHADRLEVHAEDHWHRSLTGAQVSL